MSLVYKIHELLGSVERRGGKHAWESAGTWLLAHPAGSRFGDSVGHRDGMGEPHVGQREESPQEERCWFVLVTTRTTK